MTKNLYVGNLSWDATEEDVKEYFGGIGEVRSVNIIKDRETGRPRGFCFLEMENGDKAIDQLNGSEMMGRKLMVNEARPREKSSGGGRRDGYERSYGR